MIVNIPTIKYNEAKSLQRRDCYSQLQEYIKSDSSRVCMIYGLRRTGKTTMMFQAMYDIGIENTGYILCEQDDSYKDLCQQLNEYIAQNKTVVFVDEVTKIQSFISSSASLADYYSGTGTKIVITGTDSLGLSMAAHGELYDRTQSIHTTYVSYGEFSRLVDKTDTDDFIHYAGVLSHEENEKERSFYSRNTASHYIDTAISNNITNTFFSRKLPQSFIHRYDKLIGLHNRNTLVPTITAIVEMYSGLVTKDILDEYFKQESYSNVNLSSAIDLLERHHIFLDRNYFTEDFESQIVFALNSRRDVNDQIAPDAVSQIKEYLTELDLMVQIPLIRYNDINPKRRYSYETEEYIYQAGMKYCQAKAVMDIIRQSNELDLSPIEKNLLCNKIEEDAKGQILEVTTFVDAQHFLREQRYDIFKMQFVGDKDGEIDMIIHDKEQQSYYCFEIKHSSKIEERQQKNLIHKPYLEVLDSNFGTRKCVAVLYRGDNCSTLPNGIKYINIGDFLSNLYVSKDKSIDSIIADCLKDAAQSIKIHRKPNNSRCR